MGFFWSILGELGRVLVSTLTSPSFIFIYLLLFGLVTLQYRRLQTMSEPLLQGRKNIYGRSALVSTLLGLIGGILGSILLVFLGVDISGIAIGHLWLLAILLMLIKPRFICFAYAAGLLSISNLLFAYPSINIPQLMGLVGVLHLVESLLILINGSYSPLPVYIKKAGGLRGGFNLQLFWPIPLAALITVGMIEPPGAIVSPDWWPLLQGYTDTTVSHTYILVPVLAMLGYGEISTTQTPGQAVRKSALHLLMFSVGLLVLSVLASRYSLFLPLVALFSPLGHELVIWLGMRAENRTPLYVPPGRGVMVLDVLPGTPAYRCGLRSQDIILAVNGREVDRYLAVQQLVKSGGQSPVLEIARGTKLFTRPVSIKAQNDLGIIPVPEHDSVCYLCVSDDSVFTMATRFWRRIRNRMFTS